MNIIIEGRGVNAYTGKPIKRTKAGFPYSYEPFETWSNGKEENHSVYSDRLYSWDCEKFNAACHAVWGNREQYFDRRTPAEIERFLQHYYEAPDIRLTRVVESCNQASGYPVWHFFFQSNTVGA
jgi:hypothetical protein